jgi:hypothetical protein
VGERIFVLGATGTTGRRVVEAVLLSGRRPVIAGRDPARLQALAGELGGGLETQVVDARRPREIASSLNAGDVLVTTVGPFSRFGDAVARAAIGARAHYLDSAGEPSFTRRVFERHGPAAASAGVVMLPAFATEWVLGNVAGALALERAGAAAVRVDTGYFLVHGQATRPLGVASLARTFSGTSLASGVTLLSEPGFAWRDGRLVGERWGRRIGSFDIDGRGFLGLSTGGSEHLALPRSFPQVREVNVYLGWFGGASRVLQPLSLVGRNVLRAPTARHRVQSLLMRRTTAGGERRSAPDAGMRSLTIGIAYDEGGRLLARATLRGPELYGLTGKLLAWGAAQVSDGAARAAGALGPVEAFGLPALRDACTGAGLSVTTQ